MTRSIRGSRRAAVLLAGAAAATGLLVSGCGTGQIAETAVKAPSVQGVNTGTPDGTYLVRGLVVDFPGGEGYPAGGDAPLSVVLYNDTPDPVTVTVSTDSAREVVLAGAGASPSASPSEPTPASPSAPASPSVPASPSASGSASPSAPGLTSPSPTDQVSPSPTETTPAGAAPTVEIPPFGYAQLNQQGGRYLQLVGLNEALRAGQQVNLVFDFGNGKRVSTPAPVGVPLSPQAPPSPIIERHGGGGEEEGGH
ncbi:hypothetical protein CA850_16775 [Micromonospora echinospora]|uniref:Copper(I)-binding protein n=1 Tax=Micromonospora echinospora TaxID=1877 RepID=A0A1C4WTQ9_MICEC|nr:hypothetical protein [Micromonospora echinospora]OZV79723.1 hypothetical protein CA850_16775 [Micromonospora echinospora]SCE99676.1 hypothetical protein GA0070618_2492 [Micromonospora echinospora]